mgnify:CR=1 FL=1
MQQGDKIAARMAFKEAYAKAVADAREAGVAANWFTSFGNDMLGRQRALIEAVNKRRMPADYAVSLLPPEYGDALLIQTGAALPQLSAPSPAAKERLALMIANLKAIQ